MQVPVKTINLMGRRNPNVVTGMAGLVRGPVRNPGLGAWTDFLSAFDDIGGGINPNYKLPSISLPGSPLPTSVPVPSAGNTGSTVLNSILDKSFDIATLLIKQNPPPGTYQQTTPYGTTTVRAQDGQPIGFSAAQGSLTGSANISGILNPSTLMFAGVGLIVLLMMTKR